MFWFIAIAISITMAVAVCWPLLRSRGLMRSAGFSLVALGVVLSLLLYREIGTPSAIGVDGRPSPDNAIASHSPEQAQMGQLLQQLEQRLQDNPEDLEGWLILGRSYKTMQRYDESENALENAFLLAPENSLVMVELAEARLFASSDPEVSERERSLLERAVQADPQIQKGLWLLGIAAAQAGENSLAVDYWQRLLVQMEPGSSAAVAIQGQMESLQTDLKVEPPASGWKGFEITVSAPGPDFEAPPGSVLFVIARRPGGGGPPLGVKRIDKPRFPVTLVLADSDSMMPQVPISSSETVELLARLSLTGQPTLAEGDLQSIPAQLATGSTGGVKLTLAAN